MVPAGICCSFLAFSPPFHFRTFQVEASVSIPLQYLPDKIQQRFPQRQFSMEISPSSPNDARLFKPSSVPT
jgi:hypothetical protein